MAKVKAGTVTTASVKPDTTFRSTRNREELGATGAAPRLAKRRQPEHLMHSASKRIKRSVEPVPTTSKNGREDANQNGLGSEGLDHEDNAQTGGGGEKIYKGPSIADGPRLLLEKQDPGAVEASQTTVTRNESTGHNPENARVFGAETSSSGGVDCRGPPPQKSSKSEILEGPLQNFSTGTPQELERLQVAESYTNAAHGEATFLARATLRNTDRMDSSWTRRQLYPVLKTLSTQVLCMCADMPVGDDVGNTDISILSPPENTFWPLQSLLSHAASFLNHSGPFIDESNSTQDEEYSKDFIWQVNVAVAICLLFAPKCEREHMDELHRRFFDLFCKNETELQEWQLALLLDIKRELWTSGVREKKFSETDGLDSIFVIESMDTLSRQIQPRCSNMLTGLRNGTIRRAPRLFGLQQPCIEGIRQFARTAVILETHPECRLIDRSNNGLETAPPIVGKFLASGTSVIHPVSADVTQGEPTDAQGNGNALDGRSGQNGQTILSKQATLDNYDGHPSPRRDLAPIVSSADSHTHAEVFAESEPRKPSSNLERSFPFKRQRPGSDVSSSTKEQYEKAKLAASEKAAAKNKGIPLQPSQRRPWSAEEETALMTGLDRVHGPHWSQILAMYGPGGSVSEILKDRNQVQLKDKARNLKLFFLKTGHEVPHYLKNVTGELKTRAPAQATRSEENDQLAFFGDENRSTSRALYNAKERPNENGSLQACGPESRQILGPSMTTGTSAEQDDRSGDEHEHRQEDEEDLSNAIQLALRAIQERNGMQQLEEEQDEERIGDKMASKRQVSENANTAST